MYDIYYFSGTGNTKAVGELLKEKLHCDMYSIEYEPKIFSDILLMFPIHGFGTPLLVLKWLEELPNSSKKVAIVTTAADNMAVNKSATQSAIDILTGKGYDVCYDRIVIMPPNFLVSYPDEFVSQLYETAKIKTTHIVYELENKIKRRYSNTLLTRLTKPIFYGESRIASKAFGESLRTSESCTNCKICVTLCPRDNIKVTDGVVHFKSQCMLCMRCVYSCPEIAIESVCAKFLILSDGYNLKEILSKTKNCNYVTRKTRGFFKHFIKYIEDETI